MSAQWPQTTKIWEDSYWTEFRPHHGFHLGLFRVQTPHLDRLAREGIRFTQFYVASPICSPSRTAFTTGQFPARWRITSYLASREENERRAMVIETPAGEKIGVVLIAGLIARRIICYPKVGDVMERGKRYGLIRFGSRVDVYLPADVEPLVKLGDKTVAGETMLGRLG